MKHSAILRTLICALAMLMLLLPGATACTGDGEAQTSGVDSLSPEVPTDDADAGTVAPSTDVLTTPVTEAATLPDEATDPQTEPDTEPDTEAETEIPAIERVNVPTDPAHVTFYDFKRLKRYVAATHECNVEVVADETYGSVVKLTTTDGASDPFATLDYKGYMKEHGLTALSADEYKYIVITLRAENCTCEGFEVFYCAGAVTGATPGCNKTGYFDASGAGWQQLVFDLSSANWNGTINSLRMDFLIAPSGGGESVYIYAVDFCKTAQDAYKDFDMDLTRPGEGSDLKEKPVENVNYDKINAPDEDASVLMWFDHMTEKVPQSTVVPTDKATYVISMAGNSIENCQFFLAPTEANRSLRVEMSDMTDGAGHILRTAILREHYVNINGRMMPDALPPLDGAVTVRKGNSQGFMVKVWADMNQPAGLYQATVKVFDEETGKQIKTANVYVNVWGFSLSDATALKSAIGFSAWPLYAQYQAAGMDPGDGSGLFKIYYDFMLENRLCGYTMPYSLGDARLEAYLDNPRVTSFVINKISNDERGAYDYLKNHPDWMAKGFYYYVDEPTNQSLLNDLAARGQGLSDTFPGYRQISPFFTNIQVGDQDQIEFMKPYMNIWCTKIFAFTPREKSLLGGTQYLTTTVQESVYGKFEDRMAQLVTERGDDLWVYFCWEPGQPYTNWLALGDGTEPVVSIWQCWQTRCTGVLYWAADYWTNDPLNDLTPLIGATSHGDGVLYYPGSAVGSYEPISSFRLESIRAGIQDYQMLSMIRDALGMEAADEMVAMVSKDVVTYTNDDEYLHAVRVLLAEKVLECLK